MLNSIYRVLIHSNVSVVRVIAPTHNRLCYVQLNPFSSEAANPNQTPKPISKTAKEDSFAVNYLINTFGFSQDKALSASKYLKFDSTEKPGLVIAFLKNNGFTEEQIIRIIRKLPAVIVCHPDKTMLPKIEFFRSLGIPNSELTRVFVSAPDIFKRSLEKQIMPSGLYIKRLFDSSGTTLVSLYRFADALLCDLEAHLVPKIEILRDAGVSDTNIVALLRYQPGVLRIHTEKFRKVVQEVKEMRFDPSKINFVLAVKAFRAMSKPTWEKKVAVFKKWGWSEKDITLTFEKNPHCMLKSVDKITAVMDFVSHRMGFDSSLVLKMPELLLLSLEKRVKPRFSVYEKLLENDLIIEKGSLLRCLFQYTERDFLERFVHRYEKEVPELLQHYQKELADSKS